ncbi:MAG: 23S rRNA (adenine(2503)-C(2))-methyltransferase RlmN [Bacillota bacterium]|nr:23S rRNA (adenine(2503)-C(2))-methyltransferase RlmN [Bacillota bacterium]
MAKKNILDYNSEELNELLKAHGYPSYRSKQVFKWVQRGVDSFEEMTNVPKDLRAFIDMHYHSGMPKKVRIRESKLDATKKYLFELSDGAVIETVLLVYSYGNTVCISSQVGCRMGCRFCASAQGGLVRDLSPGEMLGQVVAVQRDIGERISNIVIMGSGEPLDNYRNLITFLHLVNSKEGLNIGLRHVTVSTCGLVREIEKLAEEGLPVTLSVSLHAGDDETRKNLMPVARKYKIKEVIAACKKYAEKTGRRITFEYSLIDGVNDSDRDAGKVAELLAGVPCHVNLIPLNPIAEYGYSQSNRDRIMRFKGIVEKHGIPVTVRRELGRDLNGACGQLRASYISEKRPKQ